MRQRERELRQQNVEVAVVSFEPAQRARAYARQLELPWPILIDERLELYRAYRMDRASFWQIWGPSTWRAYREQMRRGRRLQPSRADVRQRGGDVLIDPAGVVRLHHVGRGPADRPDVAALLERVTGSRP